MEIIIRPEDPARRTELPALAESLRQGSILGRIDVLWSEPAPDRLGPTPEAVSVAIAAVGAGGAVTVAAREILRALLSRRSVLNLEFYARRGDREERARIEGLSVQDLRRLSSGDLDAIVNRLASMLRDLFGLGPDDGDRSPGAGGNGEKQTLRGGEAEGPR
jgi:Effector Associated Constant Component 1